MFFFKTLTLKSFFRQNYILVFLIILASIVIFTNLGSQGYSLDEALTVVVAKTILINGYPSAWDGRMFLGGDGNMFTTVINGIYFWTWYPWLQFYMLVPLILLFENSLEALRFPFALFGVATVAGLYLVALDIFKKKWIAILLSIHLIFLLPFFLYVRQIHYYSPSAFFSVVLFWLLLRFINDKFTKYHELLFALTSLLLLMTNSLIWLSCLPLFIISCAFRTYKKHHINVLSREFIYSLIKENKSLLLNIAIQGVLTFLWFYIFAPFGGKNPALAYADGRPSVFVGVLQFISYSNNYIFPLIMLPFAVFTAWKIGKSNYLWIIILWIGIKLVVYALLIIPHGRFLTDIMPISILFFGFIYYYLSLHKKTVVIFVLFFIFITTNAFALILAYIMPSQTREFRFYPNDFVTELTGYYPPAYMQISKYLSQNAKSEDLFWSNYNVLEIYLYSQVPAFSPALTCDNNKGLPVKLSQQKDIRWYIFYPINRQTLNTEYCLGPKWQEYMEKNYVKRIFPLSEETYHINDPDIVNRQYPPNKIPSNSVIIYEKK